MTITSSVGGIGTTKRHFLDFLTLFSYLFFHELQITVNCAVTQGACAFGKKKKDTVDRHNERISMVEVEIPGIF